MLYWNISCVEYTYANIPSLLRPDEILSEFNVKTSGEKTEPLPFWNCIGIVLPENSISP
jgi:hypothetical protein